MVYHAKVIGPGSRVYQCEHNHRTDGNGVKRRRPPKLAGPQLGPLPNKLRLISALPS